MRFVGSVLVLVLLAARQGTAQTARTRYPSLAPLSQYLMPRDSEVALARSAAPRSMSRGAEVLILTGSGYQTAVKGTNGFVCMVARSWSAGFDDPDFWDPRLRAPICYNALAARSQVAATIKLTQVVLAGRSKAQVFDSIKAAVDNGELPAAETGSMSYMLSREQYLNNRVGRWLPHLMFYVSGTDPESWGAGLPESPILGPYHPQEGLTVFIIPVSRWSDGTPALSNEH